ncbi:MAG: FHA domain-containing protein [Pyrinomonadaceae bacterium]|nr:FHA domain-containing protein [Pyrinomonadaceae bacterium]MCX7639597.1 FHA domain-containing protein [Pyrinomonadaceae bacterium]MDW8303990.1 FHA domain-containing protein [Acidobacteriota bacterium]
MRIVLAGFNKEGLFDRKEFKEPLIRIGRDATVCQIVFSSVLYPMVSRQHAEIRFQNNQWLLSDVGSSFGTFLNGEKIYADSPLKQGDLIRLGEGGPVIKVLLLEAVDSSGKIQEKHTPILVALDGKTFSIGADDFWLGRDPSCDLVVEASVVVVSRRHARIIRQDGKFLLADNNSFNGTFLNGRRISEPSELNSSDEIQLGFGGPIFRFYLSKEEVSFPAKSQEDARKTVVFRASFVSQEISKREVAVEPTLLMKLNFGKKKELTIGREEGSDIKLDGLQISKRHARLFLSDGKVFIEDLNSTNGVFVNGQKVSRKLVRSEDLIQIGVFLIKLDQDGQISVYDTRAKTRIDIIGLTKDVKSGSKVIKLLDDISLVVMPNEFIGILGPSGAGKSTFINALNGMSPASKGVVLINNLDLYQNLNVLKQSIGYVPQDDIIHRELTVYRTLYYVAKLRLPTDVSGREINAIIDEVMEITELSERRDVPINRLSGGQRKRVSIAVELLTKPSVIFLDEPTSGLDPATGEKIMLLFRQIAESGRTVILTTHAMENIHLFDKLIVLVRGKLVFYGKPKEAISYFGVKSFKQLYDKLEEPAQKELNNTGRSPSEIMEEVAEKWRQRFLQTPQYRKNIYEPLSRITAPNRGFIKLRRNLGLVRALRQWFYLSRRYLDILLSDKLNLAILFLQAPIISFLTFLVVDDNQTRDFLYFVLSLVSIWFGTSVAAREIIREKTVYKRERMFNLGLLPYVFSKVFVLSLVVGLQCLLLFLPLKLFSFLDLTSMPGEFFGIPQLWVMFLTALVGIALGLFVSAVVKTSEMATSLVPLILIPQILFSGLVGVPSGLNKLIGVAMPATWSFDAIKRFSGLDTLEPEGAKSNGETLGKGYYKWVEEENERIIEKARQDMEKYKIDAEQVFREYERSLQESLTREQQPPAAPRLNKPPDIPNPKKIEENLSRFVVFLHPWMNEVLSQVILLVMFFVLIAATVLALRLQDNF